MPQKTNVGTIITRGGDNLISYPTRSERRQVQLYSAAEKGEFSLENIILYPSEIKKLEKDGFTVHSVKPFISKKKLFSATVEWSNVYNSAIPHLVYSYIYGIIETYPKNFVNSFAQELFVIAHRAKK